MLRLTGGELRGRSIETPAHSKTRPTQAKLRQALFNSLQTSIPEAEVLDLFAGSGALGFEALSRGATRVVFVEMSAPAAKLILKNADTLGVRDRVTVLSESVEKAQAKIAENGPFDLVLADPPYAGGWESQLLNEMDWERWLKPGAYFCLEWGKQHRKDESTLPDELPFLVKTREKNYGDSVLTTFMRR